MPDKKFIKVIVDNKFATKNSQTGKPLCEWKWALTKDKKIYFKGDISGMSFGGGWYKLGNTGFGQGLPLDTEDVMFLSNFVQENS